MLGEQRANQALVAYVAPHVAGQVKRVLVKDNQHVKAGEVLVELDARDLNVRLASARADLAAAKATLHASETELAVTQKSVDSNLAVARGGLQQAASGQGPGPTTWLSTQTALWVLVEYIRNPGLSFEQMAARLQAQRKLAVAPESIQRFFQQHGLKKTPAAPS